MRCECKKFNWDMVEDVDMKYCPYCGTAKPVENKMVLKRYEIRQDDNHDLCMYESNDKECVLKITDVMSWICFRGGYFELNDGTKSKVPYLFKNKETKITSEMLSVGYLQQYGGGKKSEDEIMDMWEHLYPVAVWLEE